LRKMFLMLMPLERLWLSITGRGHNELDRISGKKESCV
jgi:hypothetical protein